VIPPVGHSRSRVRRDGKIRYTAYYDDIGGQRRSAGTYPTRREADKAWRSAEVKVAEGRVGTLRRSRRRFGDYVRQEWLPNHVIELTTRQNYTYQLERRILPFFENMPMMEILPANVRQWVAKLRADGVKPPTIRYCTTVLSAIFTTALNDQITFLHPCVGVRTPPVARRPRRIITPEQFALIHAAIPSDELRLLVETDIETGLRWGELTELRAKDFDSSASTLLISRVVVEVTPTFAPNGQRFLVKHYPKDEEWRSLDLTSHIADLLAHHVEHLHPNELLFRAPQPSSPMQRPQRQPTDPEALGMTVPNARGRTYRHGTLSGYSAGRCKCEHCRGAYARYRAKRRAAGADQPREPRRLTTDGHIPRSWFRHQVWRPALAAAGIDFTVRVHDLRHAHASWLLNAGADLETVKERMAHTSITTTESYLHTLPGAGAKAVAAIDSARGRRTR
jgi:integrase